MKIAPAAAARFLGAPDPRARAILVYGPDLGLVRERAEALCRTAVADLADPFRTAVIPAAALKDDPSRVADEAATLSFVGGRRVVRVRDATDSCTEAIENCLAAEPPGEALVVVDAGDLGPRSRLRRLFEAAENAAAIACYTDDAQSLAGVIRDVLGKEGFELEDGVVAHLAANLGADRMASRRELEKLALYAHGQRTIAMADVMAVIGDGAALVVDDIADAAAFGRHRRLTETLDRAFREGVSPISVLRSVSRHFQQLHFASGMMSQGSSPDEAMRSLRPPVFFKRVEAFKSQLRSWNSAAAGAALAALTEAEIDCKTTGLPAETICAAALTKLAARVVRPGQART